MTPETESVGEPSTESHEVVAAVDDADGRPRLVIANIARDDAWLSVPEQAAASLEEWQ
ncbi:hypothetical protein G6M89_05460 [Natronolimnobius sp. AArcel1]|uniref:DUF7556 family protein n=1 Tax=Natronolimnobius sp. AArcel1 TaxID=1679093 RepID=UPI0013EBDFFF|nr:hypothetical protein [Natronolimnobius sp. AArcel1]NGM68461.1 hypothetical protein [Natronolimnobius sp. AArcel1]